MLKLWFLDTPLAETLATLPSSDKTNVVESFSWDWQKFHTRLVKSLDNDSAPDIIEVGNTWTSRLIQEGILLNITQFVTDLNPASTFFPPLLNSCRHPFEIDQYYALPILADIRLLFYSKKHLDSYLSNHPKAFDSWWAFEKMCQDLKKKLPGRVLAWPLDQNGYYDLLPWVWLAGGDFISQSGEVLMDSERTVEAIYRLIHLILTNCSPLPPNPNFNTPNSVRLQFLAGNIAIMAGSYWMSHMDGWQEHFEAALYPPDLFPATFTGGSNLAIVRKHGGNENNDAYKEAKKFLASAARVEMQTLFAKGAGKLPCNIQAWNQMREQALNESDRKLLETFNKSLFYTVARGIPNLSNSVQVEEEMKILMETIWKKTGEIKQMSTSVTETKLEAECKEMLRVELCKTKDRIEKYLIGYTIQYTREEVERMCIKPPGHFDLWLEQASDSQPHAVYIHGRGKIAKGIGRNPFQILWELIHAPDRTISREKLLELIWDYRAISDREFLNLIDEVVDWGNKALELVKLLEKTVGSTLPQLDHHIQSPPKPSRRAIILKATIEDLKSEIRQNPNVSIEQIQKLLLKRMIEPYEHINYVVNQLNRTKVEDNLRVTFNSLEQILGEIRGIRVVNRYDQDEEQFFQMDKNLSVCLVVS